MIIGSGGGGIDVGEAQYRDFFTDGGKHVTPYAIAVGIVGMISSEVSISLGLRGISHVLSTGCTSSTDALGYAAPLIRCRRGRRAAVGRRRWVRHAGHDLRLLADARDVDALQRPAGRGVAAVRSRPRRVRARRRRLDVCARARRARARRGAPRSTRRSRAMPRPATPTIACRWIRTAPRSCAAMRGAVERAGRALDEIGYVNYHGTSTQLNDAIESRARARVFGALADRVPGSSTKSMIGHPQGASGAAGIVATALALARGFLPPTTNLTDPDPGLRHRLRPQQRPAGAARRRAVQLPRVRIEEQRDRARAAATMRLTMCPDRRRAGRRDRMAAPRRWRAPGVRVTLSSIAPTFPRDKLCGDSLNPGAHDAAGAGTAWRRRSSRQGAADSRHAASPDRQAPPCRRPLCRRRRRPQPPPARSRRAAARGSGRGGRAFEPGVRVQGASADAQPARRAVVTASSSGRDGRSARRGARDRDCRRRPPFRDCVWPRTWPGTPRVRDGGRSAPTSRGVDGCRGCGEMHVRRRPLHRCGAAARRSDERLPRRSGACRRELDAIAPRRGARGRDASRTSSSRGRFDRARRVTRCPGARSARRRRRARGSGRSAAGGRRRRVHRSDDR